MQQVQQSYDSHLLPALVGKIPNCAAAFFTPTSSVEELVFMREKLRQQAPNSRAYS